MRKITLPKDELFQKFVVENLSYDECANYFDACSRTIGRHCRKHEFRKSKEQGLECFAKRNGVINNFQPEKSKNKARQTKLAKYGDEYGCNPEKSAQTKIERYGIHHLARTSMQTLFKNRGVSNPSQLPEVKALYKNERGVESTHRKIHETMKRNGTYKRTKSAPEQRCFKLLQSVYPDAIDNRDPDFKYPGRVDMYVPSLDLFIEYQGHQTHGFKPYEQTSSDVKRKHELEQKTKPMYKKILEVWTIKDPQKRQGAKNHGLNWLEFFSEEKFLEGIANL